ncbi:MAG: hypothetical protein ACI8ZV_002509, partial [Chitinophagales bacterium]
NRYLFIWLLYKLFVWHGMPVVGGNFPIHHLIQMAG